MWRGRKARGVCAAVTLWALTAGLKGQQSPAVPAEDMAEYLPPGSGKALVVSECAGCHELARIVVLRQASEAWKTLALRMVNDEGAKLSPADVETVTTYLGEVLGPAAPPLVDVNTADREQMIKLPGLTGELADRLIEHRTARGLFVSREEVRSVLALDEAAFEKIRWYLRVQRTPLSLKR